MDVAQELHRLSREGKWKEMPHAISDEMLDEWAVIATEDTFVDRMKERAEGLFSTVLLDLPGSFWHDDDWLREVIARLK